MAPPVPGIDQQQPLPPPPPTGQSVLPPSGAFPGSLTPGWNDPPPLAMDSSNNRRPRLDLRKRVAYPMDGTISGSNAPSNVDMAASLANPLRPVAMVPPQRQTPYVDYGSSGSGSSSSNSNNNNSNNDAARLPPLATGSGGMVPVAMVPPRQK